MDFSKFRASGELSDIVVVVDGEENKLHKFPLYARSDYFCHLARSRVGGESEVARLELENFPGGNEVFQSVADFCYNMPVSLAKTNVVSIRCAAEYLQMKGAGNLEDIADKCIQDTISSAKLSRSNTAILSMLMDCNKLGEISKSAGIVDVCVDALVDCLSKTLHKFVPASTDSSSFSKVAPRLNDENSSPSAFSKVQTDSTTTTNSQNVLDEVGINCLVSIQSSWFSSILCKGKDRGMPVTKLGALAVRYVTSAIERDSINGSIETAAKDSEETEKERDTSVTTGASSTSSPASFLQAEQIGNVLDTVILSLPEHAYSIPSVTMEWLTKVLRIATSRGCKCRAHLVRVAGEMLTHLGPEDLCIISPSVLHDIVEDANVSTTTQEHDDTTGQSISTSVHSERACKLVDTYLGQMTSKGILTAETFRLLASATKDYPRPSHDFLYTVLEFVLDADKDKLSEDQQQELVDIVNFDLLTEPNLQKALDKNIAPPTKVATSAVKLCSKLRTELESVKYIAEMQEQDIQKYQTVATSTSSRLSPRSSPPLITNLVHFTSYHGIERTPEAGFADTLETGIKSPITALSDHDTSADFHKTDALQAAQNVLNAARHKLALPVYTGYRPSHLTHLHSPSYASQSSRSNVVEHDISLEEELEFKFDRSFRNLDPRVRHHHRTGLRDNSHSSHNTHLNSPRSYFPYSGSSYRY